MVPFQAEREVERSERIDLCLCLLSRHHVPLVRRGGFQAFSSPGPLSVGEENICIAVFRDRLKLQNETSSLSENLRRGTEWWAGGNA